MPTAKGCEKYMHFQTLLKLTEKPKCQNEYNSDILRVNKTFESYNIFIFPYFGQL